jgi:hypothetical protein
VIEHSRTSSRYKPQRKPIRPRSLKLLGLFKWAATLLCLTVIALSCLSRSREFGYHRAGSGFCIAGGVLIVGQVYVDRHPQYSMPGWFYRPYNGQPLVEASMGGWFRDGLWLTFPLLLYAWPPGLGAAVLWYGCWWLKKRRYGDGACAHCGYNLTGNVTGCCSECGAAIKTEGMPA